MFFFFWTKGWFRYVSRFVCDSTRMFTMIEMIWSGSVKRLLSINVFEGAIPHGVWWCWGAQCARLLEECWIELKTHFLERPGTGSASFWRGCPRTTLETSTATPCFRIFRFSYCFPLNPRISIDFDLDKGPGWVNFKQIWKKLGSRSNSPWGSLDDIPLAADLPFPLEGWWWKTNETCRGIWWHSDMLHGLHPTVMEMATAMMWRATMATAGPHGSTTKTRGNENRC